MFQTEKYRMWMGRYAQDAFDPETNFILGLIYEDAGHNAGAASFYLRTAEFSMEKDSLLAYEALLRLSFVIDKQCHRFYSARGALLKAVALEPKRPEGYFLLSRFYERVPEYEDAYFVACMGLENSDFTVGPLRTNLQYPGIHALLFEKAVSGWWVGKRAESLNIFSILNNMDLDPLHRGAVTSNMVNLGIGDRVRGNTAVPEGRLFFDIGANRGEAVGVALGNGYERVVALEPAPVIYSTLIGNYGSDPRVVCLDLAVSDVSDATVPFYEAEEDGLSSLEIDWLTGEDARYRGRAFHEIEVRTVTMDDLIEQHGLPDLVKIDVEGAESSVIRGLSKKPTNLVFEWHEEELHKVYDNLVRLRDINGYTEYALQYITYHIHAPKDYRQLKDLTLESLLAWHEEAKVSWEAGEWIHGGRLRATADAGMMWVK